MVSSGYPDSSEKQLWQRSQPGSSNMLDYSAAAVIIWGKNGEVLCANKAAALLFGYSKEELLEKPYALLFHQEDASGHSRLFEESNNQQAAGTLIAVTRQGEYIPCTVQFLPVCQEGITGTSTTIVPVPQNDKNNIPTPERKINRTAPPQGSPGNGEIVPGSSSGHHLGLLKRFPSPAWIVDEETLHFMDVNDAAVAHYGYSREEFLSMKYTFLDAAENEPVDTGISGQQDSGTQFFIPRRRHRKKNGADIVVEIRGNILAENGRKARLEVLNDITEKERTERTLKQANERFGNMLRATNDMIWDWDLEEGTFYRNSEGVKKVYGVSDNNRIKKLASWLKRVHPEDRRTVQKVMEKARQKGHCDTFEVEYRFLRDDGTYAFIYDRGIALHDEEGRPSRVVGAAQNITDRKKLEQQLLQEELEKQKMISLASIDIQERERREIGNDLHDNVNQMLTTIKLYLDISLADPTLKDDLIRKASGTLLQVINEIRHLSRSLMDPSIRDLGLLDALDDYIQSINTNRELLVSLNAAGLVEHLLPEEQKLMVFRIVQEALNNTLKHAQATAAHIELKESEGGIALTIIDDGKGFAPNTKRRGGLKNIENRVYLAAGTLSIQSAPGSGCKISVNFPVQLKNNPH